MRVILHMAATANGYIASEHDETPWSFEEWTDYSQLVGNAGNVVIGRRTYEIMKMAGDFTKIADQLVVVLTTRLAKEEGNFIFVNSPRKALEVLRERGCEEVIVAGGSKCNTSFIKEGLIDELYLNIEPLIFGKGIPPFFPDSFRNKLKLLDQRRLNENTIQLHYKVSAA